MPTITNNIIQIGDKKNIRVVAYPDLNNSTSHLKYTKGGGKFFSVLPNDKVLDGGLWHEGNELLIEDYAIKGCNNTSVMVDKKTIYSKTKKVGLFNIINGQYFWNPTNTSVLGVYKTIQLTSNPNNFEFKLNKEVLTIKTNDVNTVPRVGDYITFNKFNYYEEEQFEFINKKFNPMPFIQNTFYDIAKIIEIDFIGTGKNIVYTIKLDKTFDLKTINEYYGITLLNRQNTSIQKDLFYDTFEFLEVHQEQLLGDPYNNTSNINLMQGRSNFLNYKGSDGLGYVNLIKDIIGQQTNNTPLVFLEIHDDIKDRFSLKNNNYIANDIHFELHLPYVFLNEVKDNGDTNESPIIARNFKDDSKIGWFGELFFENDNNKKIGYLLNDLRIIVISDSELVTALSYNSNRNFVLPEPKFLLEKGNKATNEGVGIELTIIDATNTTPITIKTSTPHNLSRGTRVYIRGVLGNHSANGLHYIDVGSDPSTFKLYSVMPTYNQNNVMVTAGTPVTGAGTFIDNPANPAKVLSSVPHYNYFYTYRVRTKQNESVLPYSNLIDFNFTRNNIIDETNESTLYINIPRINTSNKVGNNATFNKGFETLAFNDGYGIDIIIGKYKQNPNSPSEVIGIEDVVFIPLNELSTPISFISQTIETGLTIYISKLDYLNALANPNRLYDIKNITPLYIPDYSTLPENLLTGEGKWLVGNVNYKNESEVYRANININVPANKWNASTNPTFNNEGNLEKRSKFITEVALYDKNGDKPVIYTKISPGIKKTNDLDLNINIKLDF